MRKGPKKYVYGHFFNINIVFEKPINIIINELEIMKTNIDRCKGVLIYLKSEVEGDNHEVAFIECHTKDMKGSTYFYDDNGIDELPIEDYRQRFLQLFDWRGYLHSKIDILLNIFKYADYNLPIRSMLLKIYE